jgi:hypothetical protein
MNLGASAPRFFFIVRLQQWAGIGDISDGTDKMATDDGA